MVIDSEPKEEGGGKDEIKTRRPKQFGENTFVLLWWFISPLKTSCKTDQYREIRDIKLKCVYSLVNSNTSTLKYFYEHLLQVVKQVPLTWTFYIYIYTELFNRLIIY